LIQKKETEKKKELLYDRPSNRVGGGCLLRTETTPSAFAFSSSTRTLHLFSCPLKSPDSPPYIRPLQEEGGVVSGFELMGASDTKFLQELILYAASAALSCLVLFAGLKHLDPNREATKKALEHKKEIAKRLGRPLIQTNPYEVQFTLAFCFLLHIFHFIVFCYLVIQFWATIFLGFCFLDVYWWVG